MPTTAPESAGQKPILLVAAIALVDADGRVLIAQRPKGKHLEGLWEFPGGKLEPGESVFDALVREFREELNLQVDSADALFSCEHVYPDRQVELHFWRVTEYQGEAEGLEGQRLRWVQADDLASLDFLEGNRALLEKVCAMVLPR